MVALEGLVIYIHYFPVLHSKLLIRKENFHKYKKKYNKLTFGLNLMVTHLFIQEITISKICLQVDLSLSA